MFNKYLRIGWHRIGQNWKTICVGVVLIYIFLKYFWTTPTSIFLKVTDNRTTLPANHFLVNEAHVCANKKLSIDCFNGVTQVAQDDPLLVQIIRNNFLYPPPLNGGYRIPDSIRFIDNPSDRVSLVADILYNFRPGFFIECGALDGISASNTFWLEKRLQWTGLLVEANQNDFSLLTQRRRKAWTSNVCLSNRPYPNKVTFYLAPPPEKGGKPGVAGLIKREDYNTIPVKVQCVPLYTLLVALNRTIVDYFSLDVEGSELDILKTVPFDKVTFKILNVENAYIPGGHKALNKFLEEKGYIFYQFAPDPDHPYDSIFLHSSLPLAQNLIQLKRQRSTHNFNGTYGLKQILQKYDDAQ